MIFFDHLFWVRLGCAQKVLHLVALRVPPTFVDSDSTNFLKTVSLCRVQIHASLLAIASSEAPLCPMSGWVCQWKPFWIPVEDSYKKRVFISDVPSEGPSSTDQGEVIPETPRVSKLASSLPWEPAKPHDKACFWERIEAPLPPLRPRPKCDFIHPRQVSPFPERLVLPFSNEVILSGYEELDARHMTEETLPLLT